jgi:phosphoglycerate dehydrogenase-like enzyme
MPIISVPDDAPPVLGKSDAFQRLRELGQVRYFDSLPNGESELIERIEAAEIVVNVRSSCKFTKNVFEACPALRMLSIWGTGTDNIDLRAARDRGITVTNTPGVSAPSVAEHTLALMLALAHRIPEQDAAVRGGKWPRGDAFSLTGKTLGILGLGAIGARMAELGRGIGMRVIGWTTHPRPIPGVEAVSLDELLRIADVVSIHLRLSPSTTGIIGAREFGMMKRSAVLVNTARGPIVDESALLDALSEGRIAGAALDVFTTEPLPAAHPLTRFRNVVLTPHSAGITPEALSAGLHLAVDNVKSYLSGTPANVVAGTGEKMTVETTR